MVHDIHVSTYMCCQMYVETLFTYLRNGVSSVVPVKGYLYNNILDKCVSNFLATVWVIQILWVFEFWWEEPD